MIKIIIAITIVALITACKYNKGDRVMIVGSNNRYGTVIDYSSGYRVLMDDNGNVELYSLSSIISIEEIRNIDR
jgi:hypothetical protein